VSEKCWHSRYAKRWGRLSRSHCRYISFMVWPSRQYQPSQTSFSITSSTLEGTSIYSFPFGSLVLKLWICLSAIGYSHHFLLSQSYLFSSPPEMRYFGLPSACALVLAGYVSAETAVSLPKSSHPERVLRAATKRSDLSRRSIKIEQKFESEVVYIEGT
jgi:hypothetical protein